MAKSKNERYAMAALAACMIAGAAMAADPPAVAPTPPVKDDGTITTPSFDLPFSSYASPEAQAAFVRRLRTPMPISFDVVKMRQIVDDNLNKPELEKQKAKYPYRSTKSMMGGVPVESFVPAAGIAQKNQDRVLINLHGGGFIVGGGGPGGAIESIPIASVGHIKVMSVDYRMAPEYHFPAASEDVAAVYRELLKTYKPENIGIYGCSAGGMLTGETVAWLLKEHLPLPGAVGIFCASTHQFDQGDSAQLWPRFGSTLRGLPPAKPDGSLGPAQVYFTGISAKDPLALPSVSKDVLKAFPPTLFLTGTRSPEMSGVVESHLELLELGVKSQLVVFDGMDHGFFTDPDLPESARAAKLIAQFFAQNLGKKR